MEKLYYDISYAREFEAEVLTCKAGRKGYEVTLDRTAFYPEGGGQPSDQGTLGGVCVLEVHEEGEQIIHFIEGPLNEGSTVKGEIDWEKRFSNMQQHSGEHIVSGLIHARYGYDNVGFHMGSKEVTIDLNGMLDWEQLMEVERAANDVIYENKPVHITYPPEEELKHTEYRSKKELTGRVRIVEVPGADVCACCGTHVSRTGEIGIIKFLTMINYKGGVRISMLCGKKALLDYEKKTDQAAAVSGLLSAKADQLPEAVERLKNEITGRDIRIGKLTNELLDLKTASYKKSGSTLLIFEENLESVQIRQFCNLLIREEKGSVVAVCRKKEEGGYHYCMGSASQDVRVPGKSLNERLSGRGGGSCQMVQGTFMTGEQEIREAFARILPGSGQKGT